MLGEVEERFGLQDAVPDEPDHPPALGDEHALAVAVGGADEHGPIERPDAGELGRGSTAGAAAARSPNAEINAAILALWATRRIVAHRPGKVRDTG